MGMAGPTSAWGVVDGVVIDGLEEEEDEADGGTDGVEELHAASVRAVAATSAAHPMVRCLRAGLETGLSLSGGARRPPPRRGDHTAIIDAHRHHGSKRDRPGMVWARTAPVSVSTPIVPGHCGRPSPPAVSSRHGFPWRIGTTAGVRSPRSC